MCLTFHVHEKNHDSEKAHFLDHEFEQMSLTILVGQSRYNLSGS